MRTRVYDMRTKLLALSVLAVLGGSCLPPTQPSGPQTANVGEQVSAFTPEGMRCHSGTFECASGPEAAWCGSWYFDMTAAGDVVGGGQITSPTLALPVQVTLRGVIDPGVDGYQIVLSSPNGGSGQLTLHYPGPTAELAGSWSFVDAPEPTGVEVGGGAAGDSCKELP